MKQRHTLEERRALPNFHTKNIQVQNVAMVKNKNKKRKTKFES